MKYVYLVNVLTVDDSYIDMIFDSEEKATQRVTYLKSEHIRISKIEEPFPWDEDLSESDHEKYDQWSREQSRNDEFIGATVIKRELN